MQRQFGGVLAIVLLLSIMIRPCSYSVAQEREPVKDAELGNTPNVHVCGSLYFAGQPTEADIERIKEQGIKRVITLRTEGEVDWDEGAKVRAAGMEFDAVPFRLPDSLTDDVFDKVRRLLKDDETPTLLHCGSANRVGAVWLTHRVLDEGVPLERAMEEAEAIGLRTPAYLEKAQDYIKRKAADQSVRPGINDRFLSADLNIEEWLGRFEVESREVFAARRAVLDATGIKAGDRIADIGAGTGFYARLFAEHVGPQGWVFAVDIAPRFLEHIVSRAAADDVSNLSAVLSGSRSVTLPPDSIDVAFTCDTYHHFEYPDATLHSIRQALRPGGHLIVIDFHRIPGKSSDFILGHVRAGKEVFQKEIEAAGFILVEETEIAGFQENYFLKFRSTKSEG